MVQIPRFGQTDVISNGSNGGDSFNLKNKPKEKNYSVRMGFMYSVISMALLWWIPVIGPFYSGYISGRKAGSAKEALIVSLVMSSLIIFTSLYLMSTQIQATSFAGNYLRDGVFAFSAQPISSVSNLAVYTESFYGQLATMSLIVPSSLVVFNATSMLGGSISSTARQEYRRPMAQKTQFSAFPSGYAELMERPQSRGTMGTREINPYNRDEEYMKEYYYERM